MCYKIEIYNIKMSYIDVSYIIDKHLFDYKTCLFSLSPLITYVDAINNIDQEHRFLLCLY